MKHIYLILAVALLVYGCQPMADTTNPPPGSPGHIGCQEGEISRNGTCVPATENNAGMFGQDLTQFVDTQNVTGEVQGFVARPKEEGDYPGVVMIHEWWGLNDNIREMAMILAKEGYVVFAVDLYNGEVAADSSIAMQLSQMARNDSNGTIQDMRNAVDYLKVVEEVDATAALGWCFGGGQALRLSVNEATDATVIYYGMLINDTSQLENLDGPVLGFFGAKDTSIPVESVNQFKSDLDSLGIPNEIYIYPNVGHAFANPSGANYAPNETMDSWNKTVMFLNENLK
jgi:carboxymethylenebutenolidase